jgi:hypothetical protein
LEKEPEKQTGSFFQKNGMLSGPALPPVNDVCQGGIENCQLKIDDYSPSNPPQCTGGNDGHTRMVIL